MSAAGTHLLTTAVRMLALASPQRFPVFQRIALLLACHSVDCCIDMFRENVIENIFYRFNPYFPMKDLPDYEDTPLDPQDCNVKL
ncbi:jg26945, partial [Pararge aegeria aegeria]